MPRLVDWIVAFARSLLIEIDNPMVECRHIEECQTAPRVDGHRRHLRPTAVRVAFGLLAMAISALGVFLGLSSVDIGGFVVVVCLIGWILGRLEPTQASQRRLKGFPRKICLRGSMLHILTPEGEQRFLLSECCWFLGSNTDDPLLNAGGKALCVPVIVSPTGHRFACGSEQGNAEAWIQAIEESECSRVARREGTTGFLVRMMFLAVFLVGGVCGYHGAHLVGSMLFRDRQLSKEIVVASGITCVAFGGLLCVWMLLPGWYRPIASERRHLYVFAALLPTGIAMSPRRFVVLPLGPAITFSLLGAIVLLLATWAAISWKESQQRDRHER